MPNLSLNELKQIAKMRRIKNYKDMSKEILLTLCRMGEGVKSLLPPYQFFPSNFYKRRK